MSLMWQRAMDALGRQQWLDPIADRVQQSVVTVYQSAGGVGQKLKNAMHGTWLGHPLHPVLTDVPVGAWTAAAVFDALEAGGQKRLGPAADAALTLGLVAAVPTALAGLTDWSATDGRARRQGIIHAWLNGVATVLYVGSLLLRRSGNRPAGRGLAYAAYSVVSASAYIGGHLSYGERIGIDHAPRDVKLDDFTPVIKDTDLPAETPTPAELNGTPLLLVRKGGQVYALVATCAHLGGPLPEGTLEDDSIVCPWHGSRFALKDGRVLDGPSAYAQPCFVARVREGQIEVGRES
jgi:nitrite reductase/ring-hydroxylating ferredoxin subunit/uncharacterized membrane protein